MAKRGLKPKVEGREPNMLCQCKSGKKYKRCCGKHMKGTGKIPRGSANRKENAELKKFDRDTKKQMLLAAMSQLRPTIKR